MTENQTHIKIAIPTADGLLDGHFGGVRQFTLVEVDHSKSGDRKVMGVRPPPPAPTSFTRFKATGKLSGLDSKGTQRLQTPSNSFRIGTCILKAQRPLLSAGKPRLWFPAGWRPAVFPPASLPNAARRIFSRWAVSYPPGPQSGARRSSFAAGRTRK